MRAPIRARLRFALSSLVGSRMLSKENIGGFVCERGRKRGGGGRGYVRFISKRGPTSASCTCFGGIFTKT